MKSVKKPQKWPEIIISFIDYTSKHIFKPGKNIKESYNLSSRTRTRLRRDRRDIVVVNFIYDAQNGQ